jgi:hypothetical protein
MSNHPEVTKNGIDKAKAKNKSLANFKHKQSETQMCGKWQATTLTTMEYGSGSAGRQRIQNQVRQPDVIVASNNNHGVVEVRRSY